MKGSRWLFVVLALWAAAWATPAATDTRGVACHGCTPDQMRSTASSASSGGTVYVFNLPNEQVRKYFVYFDVDENSRRYRVTKVTEETPAEDELDRAWRDVVRSWKEADESLVVLPPEFPIRSAAGALLDPGSAETAIEDHLSGFSLRGLRVRTLTLFGSMFNYSIPVFSGLVGDLRIIIEFPDGSSIEAVVQMDNMITADGRYEPTLEITLFDDGRLPDGAPVPGYAPAFDGLDINDHHGSLWDWILWAREHGITVTGPGGQKVPLCPTRMTCTFSGGSGTCTVTGTTGC